MLSTMPDLWAHAPGAGWLFGVLLSGGVVYYVLFRPDRFVAAMAVFAAGLPPGLLALVFARGQLDAAAVTLIWIQVCYGVLGLTVILLRGRQTRGKAATEPHSA